MKIVADDGILGLSHILQSYDELVLLPGREISRADLLDADALFVRSITQVDAKLLEGTKVRFVGTATSGSNHVDENYLSATNIQFVDAKGANARAVVDYVFAVLALIANSDGVSLRNEKIGIIGLGCVGGLLDELLRNAGFETLCCDPPRAEAEGLEELVALEEVMSCRIVCVHVPLIHSGSHPTQALISSRELAYLPDSAVLINPSRGGIVDESAIEEQNRRDPSFRYCADVWAEEPRVSLRALNAAWLATPHIAGYSMQAKNAATLKLFGALQQHYFSAAMQKDAELVQRMLSSCQSALASVQPDAMQLQRGESAWGILARIFDLRSIEAQFREVGIRGIQPSDFDGLRRPLLARQENDHVRVAGNTEQLDEEDLQLLDALGIQLLDSVAV